MEARTERYAARLKVCEGCEHYIAPVLYGQRPTCKLIRLEYGERPPCQKQFIRILWGEAPHPLPDCKWHDAGV